MTVDPRAQSGFTSADAYERGRPSYPAAMVANVGRELGLTATSTALDLAAGTGKLTRLLVPLVGRVIAVDPSRAMLAELGEQVPDAEILVGTAEAIPLEDESVDAVFVGEAFHWFRPAQACREIARVLSPGGGLALLWNAARWSAQEHPWLDAFDALVKPHRQAAGPFPAGEEHWKRGLEETGLFAPLSHAEVEHVHTISVEDFVALVSSFSWIANLPDDHRASLLAEIGELLGPDERLELRYRAEVYWTRLA